MEVFSVNRNRMYALLLAALFLFAAAPAMATWVQPQLPAVPVSVDQVLPTSLTAKPAANLLEEPISADVLAAMAAPTGTPARVYVTAATITNYFNHLGVTAPAYQQKIPVFSLSGIGEASKDILVMYPLASDFIGAAVGNLRAVKVRGTSGGVQKTYSGVFASGDIADGKFAIISSDKKSVMTSAATLAAGNYIAFCITVSGDSYYNIGSGDVVIDPVFVYSTTAVVPVSGVTVTPAKKVVAAGTSTFSFTAVVSPDTATNKTVAWSSGSSSIAAVNSSTGLVTVPSGVAENSTATITATSASDSSKTGSGQVVVGTPVTAVSLDPTTATILVGGTVTLTPTVSPADATLKTVTWSSSNTSVATVNSSGVVTGVSAGTAVITATTDDGGSTHGKTASATITVTTAVGPEPAVPGFSDSELPSGVGVATSVIFPSSISASGLNSAAAGIVGSTEENGTTYLRMLGTYIQDALAYRSGTMDKDIYIPLPVIKGYVTSSRTTGLFMVELTYWSSFSSLVGKKAGEIALVKGVSTSASASKLFTFVDAASKFTDGTFAFSKDGRTLMKADEKFVSGQTYYILYAIKDNGGYDANATELVIADPCFVGLVTGTGSSGGCGVTGFTPAAVLLALPLLVLLRRR